MTTKRTTTQQRKHGKPRTVLFWKPVFIISMSIYFLFAAASLAQEQSPQEEAEGAAGEGVSYDSEQGDSAEAVSVLEQEGPDTEAVESEPEESDLDESVDVIEEVEVHDESLVQKMQYNFAGSAQLDYLLVATDLEARDQTFDGFTTELSLKFSVDVTDHFTVAVKTCYTCHGFEIGMAYMDLRASDKLIVRAGRFVPPFGDFPVRHDPANHRTSDKPLAYDMGRMLRMREWNLGVLPSPYVDNGVSILGTFDLGDIGFFDYAVYAIGGLRAAAQATDVDWLQSASSTYYYVDNNSTPTAGGRLALGFFLGESSTLKIGLSGMWGTYDPDNELDSLILGADLVLKVKAVTFRSEYLLRRTKMWLGDNPKDSFRYGPGKDGKYDPYFVLDSFYAETDFALLRWLELVARVDGLRRIGNVPVGSPLRSKSAVLRYTGGINFVLPFFFRIKLSGEFYDFSDFQDEVALHLGLVGAF